MSGVMKISGQ